MGDELFDMFSALSNDTEKVSRDRDIVRAPFGYPGGKDRSVNQILDILPVREKWVDCCGGSGIITLNRQRSSILDVYNDRWSGVVAFFRCLRDATLLERLIDQIHLTMHAREEFVYAKANYDNPNLDDVERANLFYQMIVQSFSTLGRNWARSLNTRMSFKRTIDIPHWKQIHARMAECQIENLDVNQCLADYDSEGTVFYIDPPYPYTDTGIYKHKFNDDAHREMLNRVFTKVGYVAVSSYKNDIYDKYPWDDVHVWEVPVTIDSRSSTEGGNREYKGGKIARAFECLYIKEES